MLWRGTTTNFNLPSMVCAPNLSLVFNVLQCYSELCQVCGTLYSIRDMDHDLFISSVFSNSFLYSAEWDPCLCVVWSEPRSSDTTLWGSFLDILLLHRLLVPIYPSVFNRLQRASLEPLLFILQTKCCGFICPPCPALLRRHLCLGSSGKRTWGDKKSSGGSLYTPEVPTPLTRGASASATSIILLFGDWAWDTREKKTNK